MSLMVAVVVAVLVVVAPAADATKYYDSNFGVSGVAAGGGFGTTNGGVGEIAVNDPAITTDGSAQSGWTYVLDRGNNRIQAFDQNNAFQFAIGRDVVAATVNEQQLLRVTATGGSYTLTFNGQTTGSLAFNASAATVQTALRALSTITGTNVTVTGGPGNPTGSAPYIITFAGTLAAANQPQITSTTGALTGSATVSTLADGSATPGAGDTSERQTVTVGGGATGGDFALSFGSTAPTTATIPFGATAADVDTQLETIGGIGAGGVNVTGPDGGPYAVEFSGARASIDQPQITANAAGLTPSGSVSLATTQDGASFERCTVAGQCKAGTNAAPASAALGNAGTFNVANGIAIDQATGHLFVRERNSNARVQEFTATGQFVRAFGWDVVASGPGNSGGLETCNAAAADICKSGVTGSGPGQFGSTTETTANGIVVAPPGTSLAGHVFVADPGPSGAAGLPNRRILHFQVPASPTGAVGAEPSLGDSGRFGGDGTGADQPRSLAMGPDGVLYATSALSPGGIVRYDTVEEFFLSPIITGSGPLQPLLPTAFGITSMDLDPTSGHLLVTPQFDVPFAVVELDVTGKPDTVGASRVVDRHGLGLNLVFNGVGVNAATGKYYATTGSSNVSTGSGQRVIVLDDSGVDPPPTVELLPPTAVGSTSANLQARINPNGPTGFATSYRFQVSTTGLDGDWHDVAGDQLVGATGDGSVPVFIDDVANDLRANEIYRVRVVTTRNPAAGTAVSAELVFVTDPAPPKVETVSAQQVTDTSAQLVGRVNPNGVATEYWFEWGDDNYGNRVPVPAAAAGSGGVDRLVGQGIGGLRPDSVYHFRLCATNELADEPVCGADRTVTTRAQVAAAGGGRAYEMVTPADKVLGRGSDSIGGPAAPDLARLQGGLPAPTGDAVNWVLFAGATDAGAGHGFTWAETYEVRSRSAEGWRGEAVVNVPPAAGASVAVMEFLGVSANLRTQQWAMGTPMFADGGQGATRVMGDKGGPRGAGWYPWLNQAWLPVPLSDSGYTTGAAAPVIGERHLVGNFDADGPQGRDVTGTRDATAPKDLAPGQTSGGTFFKSGPPDWSPQDLVNECTGAIGDNPTMIPMRSDAGTDAGPPGGPPTANGQIFGSFSAGGTTVTMDFPATTAGILPGHFVTMSGASPPIPPSATVVSVSPTSFTISTPASAAGSFAEMFIGQSATNLADDTVAARPCGEGSPTSVAGAALRVTGRLGSTRMTQMSDDGNRIFFLTPDPLAVTQGDCGNATGAGTICPPQLFVRQYDAAGNATVRWLSRAEDRLAKGTADGGIGPQLIGAFGNGAAFEGASLDGSVVYFRTNAPLLENDPNGGMNRLSAAAGASWDLYRYELGNDADPGSGDPGDRLTRVSGGPTGTADPNTNCTSSAANCGGQANGQGGAVRFMSDDGNRAYFVTAAGIPGADGSPPAGAAESQTPTPAGSQVNATSRNLYLYDATKPPGSAYTFIARLPFATSSLDGCATFDVGTKGTPHSTNPAARLMDRHPSNCVHGTTSGDAIAFETAARLTPDDVDDAIDIYLYDATKDSVTRVTAPPAGSKPYVCQSNPVRHCNGDFGMTGGRTTGAAPASGLFGLSGPRHWNIAQDEVGSLKALYFESRLPLHPDDVNGAGPVAETGGEGYMDVYEWRQGRLSLVSPADTPNSAFYSGNSRDGRSVFFWSEQRISAWEINEADGDLYVARVGGGFADPPVAPAVCGVLAGGCQGAGASPLSVQTETTSSSGGGNVVSDKRKTLRVSGPSAKARKAAARSGKLTLSIRTSKAGKVSAVAKGRIGKRTRRVASKSVRVRKAGVARLKLRLSREARQQLSRGKALKLLIKVTSPGVRSRSMSVRLPGVKS